MVVTEFFSWLNNGFFLLLDRDLHIPVKCHSLTEFTLQMKNLDNFKIEELI